VTDVAELDTARRYLVPVARLDLPGEPDVVHLSLYTWEPRWNEWVTDLALCGRSTEQGALSAGTKVSCGECLEYRPRYEAALARQTRAVQAREAARSERAHAAATAENGAWFTVWLEGNWRWLSSRMTTEQREYAADCIARYSSYLAEVDGEPERAEPDGLRWWRDGER
jgi:hypothetical protein